MADIPPVGAPFSGNLGIYSALTAIKPNSGEAPVFVLWNTLCATYFPPGEGLKTAVGRPALRDDTEPDLAVITIWSARRNLNVSEDLHENQVLFIECKRPSRDTPVEWASASEQLAHYCRSNANVSRRFLAATAIGTKVKFWRYDAPSSQLESDVPALSSISGVLDLSEGHGQTEAIQVLAYVRNEGVNWTESGKGGIH
ncbi:hypothetical protein BP00DRAFT_399707 [Aspergillus indologenus CBS 114.80]|uniref:Fungal-type protein kinase domain-containing protein n=1 Tax=Aspergillus indologenus CBS 114.80 TaxID=1450541 RepID=A0A2V5I6W6_9EURO|nr:hypothetical protein BP00DRAFT_399707 [Aspergillus indologenus CBS 114.80]